MPRRILATATVERFANAQGSAVIDGLRQAVAYLDAAPHVLEGCRVDGHPDLREWLFDAAGKTWRITVDIRTCWPDWSIMTLEEFSRRR